MVTFPVLTPVLIDRLEKAARRKGYDALRRAAALPGNPYEVVVHQHRDLLAYCVGKLPTLPWYNTITGLSEASLDELDPLLSLYTSMNIPPTVSMWATHLTPAVSRVLFDRQFTVRSIGATLYTVAQVPDQRSVSRVSIRELSVGEETSLFNSVLVDGYEFRDPVQRALACLENEGDEVRRYLASVDGQPAAVATLTAHEGIAYLAGAATLPAFRGLGAQTALIRARLADAAQTSELVVVTTAFTSRSQHNLEKNGFRLAHVKMSWSPRHNLD